jgi:hypothetical protein
MDSLCARVRCCRVTLQDARLMATLDSFLARYGFGCNLAFRSLLLSFPLPVKAMLAPSPKAMAYALAALVAGVLLLLKLYREYHLEPFRTFAGARRTAPPRRREGAVHGAPVPHR